MHHRYVKTTSHLWWSLGGHLSCAHPLHLGLRPQLGDSQRWKTQRHLTQRDSVLQSQDLSHHFVFQGFQFLSHLGAVGNTGRQRRGFSIFVTDHLVLMLNTGRERGGFSICPNLWLIQKLSELICTYMCINIFNLYCIHIHVYTVIGILVTWSCP